MIRGPNRFWSDGTHSVSCSFVGYYKIKDAVGLVRRLVHLLRHHEGTQEVREFPNIWVVLFLPVDIEYTWIEDR